MQQKNWWLIPAIVVAGLLLTACSPAAPQTYNQPAAHVDVIQGSDLKRVTLVAKAVDRLGIQMTAIREEAVTRTQTESGLIMIGRNADPNKLYLRVQFINDADLSQIDPGQPVTILPLTTTDQPSNITAHPVDPQDPNKPGLTLPLLVTAQPYGTGVVTQEVTRYYQLDSPASKLQPGQPVLAQFVRNGGGTLRKLVPYSAIVYDTQGATWVYTNPEPLTFIRTPVAVDYIDGDDAILSNGPDTDVEVVTVGAEELYGAEFEFQEE